MFNLNTLVILDEIKNMIDGNITTEDSPNMLGEGDMIGGEIKYNLVKTSRKCNRNFDMEQTSFTYTINNNAQQASLFYTEINFRIFF
jgi:hypothetical protein